MLFYLKLFKNISIYIFKLKTLRMDRLDMCLLIQSLSSLSLSLSSHKTETRLLDVYGENLEDITCLPESLRFKRSKATSLSLFDVGATP